MMHCKSFLALWNAGCNLNVVIHIFKNWRESLLTFLHSAVKYYIIHYILAFLAFSLLKLERVIIAYHEFRKINIVHSCSKLNEVYHTHTHTPLNSCQDNMSWTWNRSLKCYNSVLNNALLRGTVNSRRWHYNYNWDQIKWFPLRRSNPGRQLKLQYREIRAEFKYHEWIVLEQMIALNISILKIVLLKFKTWTCAVLFTNYTAWVTNTRECRKTKPAVLSFFSGFQIRKQG